MESRKSFLSPSEITLILAGILMLVGAILIYTGDDFSVWFTAKAFYALGFILLLINK